VTASDRNLTSLGAGILRPRWKRPLKWLLVSVATCFLLVALLLGAFGIVVGRVPEYRVQVQNWLSDKTGLVIEFSALSARLRLFGPELIFDEAVVRTPDRSHVLAAARRGSVAFDIWNSLRNGQLSAGRFSLHSPELSVIRTLDGRFQLLGQSALPQREFEPIAIELLPTGHFRVTDAVVSFRDERTGRGPWSVSGVSFDLTRSVDAMHLSGAASLPVALGKTLKFAANADGPLHNPHDVRSSFSISGEELDLAGWADVAADAWSGPESGRGTLQLSGTLRGAELTSLTAHVDFRDLAGQLPQWSVPLPTAERLPASVDQDVEDGDAEVAGDDDPDDSSAAPAGADSALAQSAEEPVQADANRTHSAEVASYSRIAFSLSAQRMADEWRVVISDLDVSRPGSPWRSARIDATWSNVQGATKASVTADRIVLANLWPLLAYFPESSGLATARALRATGSVDALQVAFERDADALRYSANAKFTDVSFAPIGRAPGFKHLSGVLEATEQGGTLDLRSRDPQFELPRMFRDALEAQSLEGKIAWEVADDGVTARTDELRIVSVDGRARAQGSVFAPRDRSSPILRLSAEGEDLSIGATHKYVPRHRLRAKTLEWFDRAFIGGRVTRAKVDLDGPTRAFPFRRGEGTFTALATVENGAFEYHADWQPATDIAAEAVFRNGGMTVRASRARIGNVVTTAATATIEDFKRNELRIEANASGTLPDAVEFLRLSPLRAKLEPYLSRVDARGSMNADVRLYFPIKQMTKRDIVIVGKVEDATFTYAGAHEPMKRLRGTITLHNTLVESGDLQGQWLDGPLTVQVRPTSDSTSQLTATGRGSSAALSSLFRLPASVAIDGEADWRFTAQVKDSGRPVERAFVNLDLREMRVALPEPVGKHAGVPGTLDAELTFDEPGRVLTRAAFGEVRALVSVRNRRGGWQLESGGVRADGVAPALPSHRGIRVEGTIDRFVLDDWLALRGDASDGQRGRDGAENGKSLSTFLQAANVRLNRFEMFGYEWRDLRGVMQATASGWRVDVAGPEAEGQVLIPEPLAGTVPLRAAMERLELTKTRRETPRTEVRNSVDPRNLPALDVHVMEARVHGRALGAVDIAASRAPDGLRIDEARISGASARAEGRGHWLMGDDGPYAALTATITSSDVASTLQALDYTPFLEARHGEIRADLRWQGGFDRNILEVAAGEIKVRAESGQIVNLQPGAGRMLGLFSIAALPRRLALDFSDLTDKGLAFDTIHGDFELRDGNAHTTNLLLQGPAAEIGIAGRTGFKTRDYDQTAVVTGNLGASLPVAGALAGGPAVGAALLLFSQVFKEPLKGMTRGYYRITGPWDNPTVERVGAPDAKDATARDQAR
jgi:uncharacterized protein (TIGR02099 family)